MSIAQSVRTVIDCSDPGELAAFYGALLGWKVRVKGDNSWAGVWSGDGVRSIRFQQVANYRRPTWPEESTPQQMHLDLNVSDLDVAELEVLAIEPGPTRAPFQPGDSYRVFLDPAGHPFCLTLTK